MDYEKLYKEALERAKKVNECKADDREPGTRLCEYIFPELAESEDERIRKEIVTHCRNIRCVTEEGAEKIAKWIAWLEKQKGCEYIKKDWLEHIKQSWYKEGFIDGKYCGGKSKEWTINDSTTLNELIDFLENGTAKLQHDLTRYANWLKIRFTPIEKQGKKETNDKNKPKFKVKYAVGEYNVVDEKDIDGVTFYGIEDEPNHIDYVKADTCEIINGGYGIKEGGFSIPTKPAMFSKQKPTTLSEEDEKIRKTLIAFHKSTIDIDGIKGSNIVDWLEKQVSEPNWCHHKVDLSGYSEEYRKAYYDGRNNCNMQHSQCKIELDDVVKCLINGMKFYYEDNEYATWGTEKWSMPVKHIIDVLEKQVPADEDKVARGVRQDVALSIINHLNRNTLGMCLSSMERADLESAVVDSDWSKVYDYMKMKLDKQVESEKPLYIRFGDIPTNGKSKVYNGEAETGIEEGVSVYPAFETNGDIVMGLNLPITRSTLHTQQALLEYENRPCYLVTGDYVGKGTDGEPLIENVRIIKEIKPYRIKQEKENNP